MKILHAAKVFLRKRSDGKILVSTRAENKKILPGCFEFSAGGMLEINENPKEAVLREMQEELNLQCNVEHFDFVDYVSRVTGDYIILHLYVGELEQDNISFNKDEIKEIVFYSLDEINALIKNQDENKFDMGYIQAFAKLQKFLEKEKRA